MPVQMVALVQAKVIKMWASLQMVEQCTRSIRFEDCVKHHKAIIRLSLPLSRAVGPASKDVVRELRLILEKDAKQDKAVSTHSG